MLKHVNVCNRRNSSRKNRRSPVPAPSDARKAVHCNYGVPLGTVGSIHRHPALASVARCLSQTRPVCISSGTINTLNFVILKWKHELSLGSGHSARIIPQRRGLSPTLSTFTVAKFRLPCLICTYWARTKGISFQSAFTNHFANERTYTSAPQSHRTAPWEQMSSRFQRGISDLVKFGLRRSSILCGTTFLGSLQVCEIAERSASFDVRK